VHDLPPSVPSADLPDLVRVAALGVASRESRTVRRRAAEGAEVRVGPGVFVSADRWRHCDERQRHVLRVLARVPRLADRVAASHWSAAALHRFPCLEPWPTTVSVVDPVRTTTQSVSGVLRRVGVLPDEDVVTVHGVRATSVGRSAVDLAVASDFARAVVVLDAILHSGTATRAELTARLDARAERCARGIAGARRALAFADDRAESPWESFTRVQADRLGTPVPVLQQEFPLVGRTARVDFWFPDQGVVLEFDGASKYGGAAPAGDRRARAVEEAVLAEKRRENELRREHPDVVRAVVRVEASEVRSLARLRGILVEAGVPCRR